MTKIPPFLKNAKAYYFYFNNTKGYYLDNDYKFNLHHIVLLHLSTNISMNPNKNKTKKDFVNSLIFDTKECLELISRTTYFKTINELVKLGYYIPYKRKYLRNPYKIKCLTLDTFLKNKEIIDEFVLYN